MMGKSKRQNTISLDEANEKLRKGYTPGIIVFEDEDVPTTLYLHTRIQNSGWVHTIGFDGAIVDYAPGTVSAVEQAEMLSQLKADSGEREFDPEWFDYVLNNDIEVL